MAVISKAICLILYALGLAGFLGMLPEGWRIVGPIAAGVLVIHLIEIIVAFKHVRVY